MRIVFLGSGEFAVPTLRSIRNDGHEVALVVSQPDRPKGRGKELSPTPVRAAAMEAGLPAITPIDVNSPDSVAAIKAVRADLAYVAAFGQKIGSELLAAFPVGIINLHASLLPAWRGAAPIQWTVMSGDAETGVTVFRLIEKMDAGPILVQRRTAISDVETADELHDRLARIGCDAVRAALEHLATDPSAPGTPQDESKVSLAQKLKKDDGRITFDRPALALAHRICGLWSWPGAACRFVSSDGRRDEIVVLARARPFEGRAASAPSPDALGRVTEMLSVQAADGELELLEIKPAGGALMSWRDYVNGRHVQPGDRFVPTAPA
jgi:methionyl-tRNA formyltransferase